MKLSEVLINYRNRMGLSQRKFAEKCNLSNTYISFIENEMNPKTKRPITPTLKQYKTLANGMDMTLSQLLDILDDDLLTTFNETPAEYDFISEKEYELLDAWRAADDRAREDALKTLLDHPREKGITSVI